MNPFAKSPAGLFATQTLSGHLVRGAAAFGLLWFAIGRQNASPALSIGAALLALVLLRGCPMCWTIGLAETATQRFAHWRRRRGPTERATQPISR